ncbi:MAG: subclass B3 metallo-beta-lactamase [bacterium]
MTKTRFVVPAFAILLATPSFTARGQAATPDSAARAAECRSCAEWNAPQAPLRIRGNVWFVGSHGLSSILITSDAGHVLIDGGLPESAPLIAAHVRALGFRMEDVKLIVNSHDHFDHAGGIAALQAMSGARVAASAPSARVLRAGESGRDDPQFGVLLAFPPVRQVDVISDGETLHVGPIALTAHLTPGHTPGGTSWSWQSCADSQCLDFVYADSQTPVSADGFLYTRNDGYPTAIADFQRGQTVLEHLACDVLLTPHPGASAMWERLAGTNPTHPLIDPDGCRKYAANARSQLTQRIATETGKP